MKAAAMMKGSIFQSSVAGPWHTLPALETALMDITSLSNSGNKEQVL